MGENTVHDVNRNPKIIDLMVKVNLDVYKERLRQNEKWGLQRHDMGRWLSILVEEVGEFAQAMQSDMNSHKETDADDKYTELIHVAAVASAIAEHILEEKEKNVG